MATDEEIRKFDPKVQRVMRAAAQVTKAAQPRSLLPSILILVFITIGVLVVLYFFLKPPTEKPVPQETPAESPRQEQQERKAEAEQSKKEAKDGKEMVRIPAGEFWMGCNEKVDQECYDNEKPGKLVYLDAYAIDKYEVTVAEYRRCVQAGGCNSEGLTMPYWDNKEQPKWVGCNWDKEGRENHPVNCVDWEQARTYCQWARKRLPTEAEWEKAARGTDRNIYPWGNEWDAEKANDGAGGTVAVGSYPSGVSPYEVHDMAGNVWEWVQDWYDETYYKHSPSRNPEGPKSGNQKVLRGGSWSRDPRDLRVSRHTGLGPGGRGVLIGFRCAQ